MFRIQCIYATIVVVLINLSCSRFVDDVSEGSNFDTKASTSEEGLTTIDQYLYDTFVVPYNIEIKYKWDESLIDATRYLYPADPDRVRIFSEILVEAWIEPYSDLGGADFVKKIAPRQILLIGSRNLNPGTGTVTLGLADSGKRITLFDVNIINFKNKEEVVEALHTIQHEYTHILNQTEPYDLDAFSQVTPNYLSNWQDSELTVARELGFLTRYSRSNENEDFAEIVSGCLTRSPEEWEALLKTFPDDGREKFDRKVTIIVDYFNDKFGINLYELQKLISDSTARFFIK